MKLITKWKARVPRQEGTNVAFYAQARDFIFVLILFVFGFGFGTSF